jgi:hypothetical protein
MFRRKIKQQVQSSFKYFVLICLFSIPVYFFSFGKNDQHNQPEATNSVPVNPVTVNDQTLISSMLERGNYPAAIETITSDSDSFSSFWKMIFDTLIINFRFSYIPNNYHSSTGYLESEVTLMSDEPYHLLCDVSESCYLYIFQLTSSDVLASLFPNDNYSPLLNPVENSMIRIPDGINWIYLDENPGTETIYLLASRWRHQHLESLIHQKGKAKNSPQKITSKKKILEYLEAQYSASDELPGLVFSKYTFKHLNNHSQ